MDNTNPSKIALLYVTAPNEEEAESLAQQLLNNNLIACANIIPKMKSIYKWKGEIKKDSECLLILKTQEDHSPAIEKFITENHSYDTPCVLEIPIQRSSPLYLAWIQSELFDSKDII